MACQVVTRLFTPLPQPPLPAATHPSILTAIAQVTPSATAAYCPDLQAQVMAAAKADTAPADEQFPDLHLSGEGGVTLITYLVNGDQISDPRPEQVPEALLPFQQDTATQQKIWDEFTALIPSEWRREISAYVVITDGPSEELAGVVQTSNDPKRWALEVDIADAGDTMNLTYTLIHEFGHLLTLNASQVPPDIQVFNHPDNQDILDQEAATCPQYFPGEGCSLPGSYINAFFTLYWSGLYDEWHSISTIEDDEVYYRQLDAFYAKYRDQFVNDYAVTDPEEDIAESWAHFILAPKPDGVTVADQKVLFFYAYPELAQLRTEILDRLCTSLSHE